MERIYTEGDEYYADALAAIRAARERIWLDMYIFQDDPIGRRFRDALAERARAGVAVIVVYDRVGSFSTPDDFWRPLAESGALALPFRPWPWEERRKQALVLRRGWTLYLWRIFSALRYAFLRRDHRKLLIVDRSLAFTGGFNIMQENSFEIFGEARWLDVMYATTIPEIVRALERIFLDTLRRIHRPEVESLDIERKRVAEAIIYPPWLAPEMQSLAEKRLRRLRGRERARRSAHGLRRRLQDLTPNVLRNLGPNLRLRVERRSRLRASRTRVARALKRLIDRSRTRVQLMFPYFAPYGSLLRLLIRQVRRGVSVEVFLSEESDSAAINDVAFYIARRLHKHGVKIYVYHGRESPAGPARFCHAKVCVFDDWIGVGTANLDRRSLALNLETLILRKRAALLEQIELFFTELKARSTPYSPERFPGGWRGRFLYRFRRFL